VRLLRLTLASTMALGLAAALPSGAEAAAKCGRRVCDTAPPAVAITRPASGATVAGSVAVTGTASDNAGLATVAVAVDGGAWQTVAGTSSWSWTWNTTSLANGSHTIAARATDTSGNVATASAAVTVSNTAADTTAPSVAVTSPASGSTVSGTASLTGTAADNAGLSAVAVAVDGGPWQAASGTSAWTWAWNTASLANGPHTVSARATDTAGNVATSTVTLSVANATPDTTAPVVTVGSPASGATVSGSTTVSGSASDNAGLTRVEVAVDGGAWQQATGTSAWSWPWNTAGLANGAHTLTARATDTSGNVATTSRTVTVANTTGAGTCSSGAAPLRSAVTPEGAKIRVCTAAGNWTTDAIATMLAENSAAAGDLATIAPTLTIEVQDRYATQSAGVKSAAGGVYTGFKGTIYLNAAAGTTFANTPNYSFAHEYGHIWHWYYLWLARQGDWSSYLTTRWANADGSVKLGQDSRLDSTMSWSRDEIMADDYRLLFGSAKANAERTWFLNPNIPDPRDHPGLADFLLGTWRTRV
jgi:hypothetical protein